MVAYDGVFVRMSTASPNLSAARAHGERSTEPPSADPSFVCRSSPLCCHRLVIAPSCGHRLCVAIVLTVRSVSRLTGLSLSSAHSHRRCSREAAVATLSTRASRVRIRTIAAPQGTVPPPPPGPRRRFASGFWGTRPIRPQATSRATAPERNRRSRDGRRTTTCTFSRVVVLTPLRLPPSRALAPPVAPTRHPPPPALPPRRPPPPPPRSLEPRRTKAMRRAPRWRRAGSPFARMPTLNWRGVDSTSSSR